MSKEAKLIKNTAIIAIGNICTKCVSFLLLPLYTSILSTVEYGEVDMVGTYTGLLAIITTLQLEQGVFRYLIEVRDDTKSQSAYITNALCILCGMLAVMICSLSTILIPSKYQYTLYFLAIVVFTSIQGVLIQIPRGLGSNVVYTAGSCLYGITHIVFNVLFVAIFRMGVRGMLAANALSMFASVLYIVLRLKLWTKFDITLIRKNTMRELLTYSIPLIGGALCWWVIGASDRIIISLTLGAAYNGIYAVANKFPSILSIVGGIFNVAWTESASENVKDANKEDYYEKTINKAVSVYSSCNLVVLCALALFFRFLVEDSYWQAYAQIPILLVGSFMHLIASWYGAIFVAFKKTRHVAMTTAMAAAINGVVNLLTIRRIGLFGATMSSFVAFSAMALIRHKDVQRYVRIRIPTRFIICELFLYAGAFLCYYSRNILIQSAALVASLVYCFVRNKGLIEKLIQASKIKLSRWILKWKQQNG